MCSICVAYLFLSFTWCLCCMFAVTVINMLSVLSVCGLFVVCVFSICVCRVMHVHW